MLLVSLGVTQLNRFPEMNFYCWTKLCLFLDVRSEDHRIKPSSTKNSWRDSAPAAKQCYPELDSPSCQFKPPLIQSEITALAGKTYRHNILQFCPARSPTAASAHSQKFYTWSYTNPNTFIRLSEASYKLIETSNRNLS